VNFNFLSEYENKLKRVMLLFNIIAEKLGIQGIDDGSGSLGS
jgi:hypothetical protein